MSRIYTWVTRDGRLCWATRPRIITSLSTSHESCAEAEPGGSWLTVRTVVPKWAPDQLAILDRALLANFGGGAA